MRSCKQRLWKLFFKLKGQHLLSMLLAVVMVVMLSHIFFESHAPAVEYARIFLGRCAPCRKLGMGDKQLNVSTWCVMDKRRIMSKVLVLGRRCHYMACIEPRLGPFSWFKQSRGLASQVGSLATNSCKEFAVPLVGASMISLLAQSNKQVLCFVHG